MATRNGYRISAFCSLPAFAWRLAILFGTGINHRQGRFEMVRHRLAVRLHDRGIRRYFGTAPLDRAGLPEFTNFDGREPDAGYAAVRARNIALTMAKKGTFRWPLDVTPRERIGRSIYQFYLRDAH